MISSIFSPTNTLPQYGDHGTSRNSNAAGGPLPLIPRRANSALSTVNGNYHDRLQVYHANVSVRTRSKAPHAVWVNDSHSCSTVSAGGSAIDAPRYVKRGRIGGVLKPNPSEHLPLVRISDYDRRPVQGICDAVCNDASTALSPVRSPERRLRFPKKDQSTQEISKCFALDKPSTPNNTTGANKPPLVRKKSGQLVKPSLKSPSCLKERPSALTLGTSSRSEPTTPVLAKAVHFDTQLEHIKLFLAEQKPLAVSRDGSPTEDTSGTESDFPSFIYDHTTHRKARNALSMKVGNMPLSLDMLADIALETLSLTSEGSSIIGRVRVRNIAYTKVLIVRFTFDDWLTTSEINGRFLQAIDVEFDRFVFSIELQAQCPSFEVKKLIFALQYVVGGREIWDNNVGQNYIVTFSPLGLGEGLILEEPETTSISGPRNKADVSHSLYEGILAQRSLDSRGRLQGKGNSGDQSTILRASVSLDSQQYTENSYRDTWLPLQKSPKQGNKHGINANFWSEKYPITDDDVPGTVLGSPRDPDTNTFCPKIHVVSEIDQIPLSVAPPTLSVHDIGQGAPQVGQTLALLNDTISPLGELQNGSEVGSLAMPSNLQAPGIKSEDANTFRARNEERVALGGALGQQIHNSTSYRLFLDRLSRF